MGWYRHPIVGYATNFGYFYCPKHHVEQPGTLGEKCNKPHVVTTVIRGDDGWDGTRCDWPGCREQVPPRGKPTEFVDDSLHANSLPQPLYPPHIYDIKDVN